MTGTCMAACRSISSLRLWALAPSPSATPAQLRTAAMQRHKEASDIAMPPKAQHTEPGCHTDCYGISITSLRIIEQQRTCGRFRRPRGQRQR